MDLLSKKFNYQDRNIIEVGGGVFARLAKRLSLKQKNGIMVYYQNHKQKFKSLFICVII